jgi:hypothetical protein
MVPSSVADRLESGRRETAVPRELELPPAPVAVVEQLPVSADQMGGAINEEELGLPPADLDELIEKVRALPFEHAFLLSARIAAEVWHMREDADRQLELVRAFNMPNLVARLEEVLPVRDGRARRVVFAEQYLTVLERCATKSASAVANNGRDGKRHPDEQPAAGRAESTHDETKALQSAPGAPAPRPLTNAVPSCGLRCSF